MADKYLLKSGRLYYISNTGNGNWMMFDEDIEKAVLFDSEEDVNELINGLSKKERKTFDLFLHSIEKIQVA